MAFTAPLFIPLLKGLDLSKEATLGQGELHLAENVDSAVEGQLKGRPSRSAPLLFAVRDYEQSEPTYDADAPFDGIGFTPIGMVPLRDANGERPAIACEGRLFSQDGSRWVDRGAMACLRADELVSYQTNKDGTVRPGAGPDMGLVSVEASGGGFGHMTFALLASNGAVDRQVRVQINADPVLESANFARCGTTTACVMPMTNNGLAFLYRTNGSDTVSQNVVAVNASATLTDLGDAPVISASHDSAHFYIAYKTTAANVLKVLKTTVTGTVVTTYTSAAIPGLTSFWVDNSSVLKDKVALGFTHTGGFTVRILNQSLVDQACDSTVIHDGLAGLDCVVGLTSDDASLRAPTVWWAYRSPDPASVGDGGIALGYASTTSAASATETAFLYGGGTYQEPAVKWGIVHQPLQVNGRMYITLAAAANRNDTGTWMTLNLDAGMGNLPVATGPVEATIPFMAPSAATVADDDSGFTFGTLNWAQFELGQLTSTVGWSASLVLNRVSRSKAKATQYGDITVFSGSIPWAVSRGQTSELGFPFLGGMPGFTAEVAAVGGAVPIGTYSVAACWRWIDEAGQIHRSAPTRSVEVSPSGGGSSTIRAVVTNPLLTTKSDVKIEVYTTGYVSGVATTVLKLQTTVDPSLSDAYTVIDIATDPVTDTDIIYTDGGVFANYHVPADGGVAAIGRRLWMAGARAVYASKVLTPGIAPGFNDEGPLQLNLPAGAGRIVALEPLDELKLVIFCERGIYITQDGGPNDVGVGDDFTTPYKASALAVAGPRSVQSTDQGIVFAVQPDATDPARGGVWLLDRQLNLTQRNYVGRPVQDLFVDDAPDFAYSPERQQVYITTSAASDTEAGMVVVDMRAGTYGTWTHPGSTPQFLTCARGVLWVLGDEPSPYDGAPGTDDTGDYAMKVATAHLSANGQSAMGWGRVRSMRTMHAEGFGAHTLTMTATQDVTRESTSGAIAVSAATADTTWPTSWLGPEWRLPSPKCSVIKVELSATPATAKWSAIRLDVTPLPPTAPSRNRS